MQYEIKDIKGLERVYLGMVIENYVATELYKKYNHLYNYNNSIEVDFLIAKNGSVIPIEVKAANNTQSKSLKSFVQKNNPEYAIIISRKNFGFENKIKSVPEYATFLI